MDKDVRQSFNQSCTYQTPDKQERARQFAQWCQEYEGIVVGEYPYTKLGIITVTVADAVHVEQTWEFPSVALYVKIALAINTGNLKRRQLSPSEHVKRFWLDPIKQKIESVILYGK